MHDGQGQRQGGLCVGDRGQQGVNGRESEIKTSCNRRVGGIDTPRQRGPVRVG